MMSVANSPAGFRRRQITNQIMTGVMGGAALLAVIPLVLIIFHVLVHGIGALQLSLLIEDPNPPGRPGGGVFNALSGSAIMVGLGLAIGAPIALSLIHI